MSKLAQYWKAILGFITPGVVALGVAVNDTSDGGDSVTRTELVGIVVAMIATGSLVAAKRNGPSDDPTTSTPQLPVRVAVAVRRDDGHADVATVLIALACAVVVVAIYALAVR